MRLGFFFFSLFFLFFPILLLLLFLLFLIFSGVSSVSIQGRVSRYSNGRLLLRHVFFRCRVGAVHMYTL